MSDSPRGGWCDNAIERGISPALLSRFMLRMLVRAVDDQRDAHIVEADTDEQARALADWATDVDAGRIGFIFLARGRAVHVVSREDAGALN